MKRYFFTWTVLILGAAVYLWNAGAGVAVRSTVTVLEHHKSAIVSAVSYAEDCE